MNTTSPTQAALLAALKAIMAECGRVPGQRPYDLDSYLPAHLLDAAQQAIDATEAPAKATALALEAERFTQLKAEFAKHGHMLTCSLMTAELFDVPVSYLAEGEGRARYLPTLADAEKFLKQIGGASHD